MMYDPAFIYAICAVQEKYGPEKAAEVFQKLYPPEVIFPPAIPWHAQDFTSFASANDFQVSMGKFQNELNEIAHETISLTWVKETVEKVGLPSADMTMNGIPWIKAFREVSGVGLYAAKHTRDYIRDHEAEWSSIINYV